MTEKERAIERVQRGVSEPSCPELEMDCRYFCRGSEFGACSCEEWYNCKIWERVFQEREEREKI